MTGNHSRRRIMLHISKVRFHYKSGVLTKAIILTVFLTFLFTFTAKEIT
jgi:hypothetical protein